MSTNIDRISTEETPWPLAINTWNFTVSIEKAWEVLNTENGTALDAIEQGCTRCEEEQCDGTVGYGGSPDENGETTLDAMIMDGTTHDIGAIGGLRRVKSVISVARHVLEYTKHTLLAGDLATQFAVNLGFAEETLTTNHSKEQYLKWKANNCQPNFWQNVKPDPSTSCGPYKPLQRTRLPPARSTSNRRNLYGPTNHDTIGMIAIDRTGAIAVGTSTNGAAHKIPGRVGDSPIPGAGAYCDKDVGGAAATGDGDVMLRFLPSYQTVENMRNGMPPSQAAEEALKRIVPYHSDFVGAIVAVNMTGTYGAACFGIPEFPFWIASNSFGGPTMLTVPCFSIPTS